MRIFRVLCAKNKPQNPNRVPLAPPRLPLRLRDRVSTKTIKSNSTPCVQELQNLISKLAQNDFNQQFCTKEVEILNKVNGESYFNYIREKAENRSGYIKHGQQLNSVPLNNYLKRFPVVVKNPFEEKIVDSTKSAKKKN